MPASGSRFVPSPLLGLVLLGLGLRAAFVWKGAALFYHSADQFYFNADSGSYTDAFENLWRTGHYTFNFLEPDAAFGRLPGYPFFYGIHRVLFGTTLAPVATAWSQVVLDSASIILVFSILTRLAPARPVAAYAGALLYATYPFIIVWVPVIGTEVLSTDLTLLWLYAMLGLRPAAGQAVQIGGLVALNLFVREYMGILLPISIVWWLWNGRTPGNMGLAVRQALLLSFGFGVVYGAWPVRNYLLAQRLIWLKPRAAGYINQTSDVDEFYQWVHCWTLDENPWLDSVLVGKGQVAFPPHAFHSAAEEAEGQRLVALARQCGTGFYVIRRYLSVSTTDSASAPALVDTAYQRRRIQSCNDEISAGFEQLRQRFVEQEPLRFWVDVPLQNLRKAVFKHETVASKVINPGAVTRAGGLIGLAFGYRSFLLLLGWTWLLLGVRRHQGLWLVLAVGGFQYVYICAVYRGLEMRYLLQADVLLLLPAALLLERSLLLPGARLWRKLAELKT
jgi:hypothetical protein